MNESASVLKGDALGFSSGKSHVWNTISGIGGVEAACSAYNRKVVDSNPGSALVHY